MKYNKSNYYGFELKGLHLHWGQHSYKGESYRSYSLARSVRKDGKNAKEVVLKLGKLTDGEVVRWKEILAASKSGGRTVSLDDVFCAENLDYLDVAIVEAFWNHWDLSSPFPSRGRRLIDVADVAKVLTINRCIDPRSKSTVPHWLRRTHLPHKLGMKVEHFNASRIFRELETIEACKESICSHIINKVRRQNAVAVKTLFFDLSTTTFHGTKSPLVEWGKSKDGYDNHAVLALLVTEDGLPLYWDVLKGGTHDSQALSWLVKKVGNRFPVGEMTLVFDRGMVSDKNLSSLEEQNRKYITAMDRNQIEGLAQFDISLAAHLTQDNLDTELPKILRPIDQFDDHTYIIEDFIGESDKRRYTLIFNSEMFIENQRARQKKIDVFMQFVAEMNRILESAINDRARKTTEKKFEDELKKKDLERFVKVNLDFKYMRKSTLAQVERTRTFCAEAVVDEQQKGMAGRLDGFWMLVTNQIGKNSDGTFRLEPKRLIKAYRDKYVIEASFRDIKSSVEVAPVHVWTESHVKAHYTICVIAHLINRAIGQTLAAERGGASKHIISAEQLLDEASRVKLNRLAAPSVVETKLSFTTPSKVMTDLLKRIGLQNLLSQQTTKDIGALITQPSV